MLKQITTFLSLIIMLTSCSSIDAYENNLWNKYHKKTSTSSELHSKLVKVHNRDSLAFTYSPYRADFRNKL
ncbi:MULTISPECIES: hypothetical protein [Francisella]|uniref:Uncharacterized protein n=1 Tax=Francisella opportunistica TaxID=2016517 RepID=A0A345JRN3_9GAMM|nr:MULTISPECIES: hypothetical protein [Francisella]APC91715.1 putative lipoprotein [Francisella sp. MA067296]AXH29979.1 hypothetical protein CGC43_04975 [Francisella opportunistica]AXH31625.1 hypothetical protein CGC44_04930 [Francisella opportunistica]AXH33270.1 hypothetical protein CGC45_04965 [Francisella opportunistica]